MFQNSEISFSEKKFFRLLSALSRVRVPVSQRDPKGRNSPLHVIREVGLSLFGRSHGKGLKAGCLIPIQEYQSRPKIFYVKKFFNFFSK